MNSADCTLGKRDVIMLKDEYSMDWAMINF